MLLRRLRYTRLALLVFGVGLITGFVAVVGEIARLERVSSVTMALGLITLPVALFADGHGFVLLRWIAGKFSRRPPPKPRTRARAPKPKPALGRPGATRQPAQPRSRAAPARPRRKRR